jgi:hypothetical protein
MGFHGAAQGAVVDVHEAGHRLRIETLVQRRRARQVGEENGDDLASFAGFRVQASGCGIP